MTFTLGSFAAEGKILETQLSFNASTMIVDQFFFKTDEVVISDAKWDVRDFDFKISNIRCNFSTPIYFYELGNGCMADYNGKSIGLTLPMSTILMAAVPSEILGGDAAGSLFYMIDELNCVGRSRSSSCVMKIKQFN
jgi:hypothetical protein